MCSTSCARWLYNVSKAVSLVKKKWWKNYKFSKFTLNPLQNDIDMEEVDSCSQSQKENKHNMYLNSDLHGPMHKPETIWNVIIWFYDVFFKEDFLTKHIVPKYSKIPILRPPLRPSNHFWTVPKVVSDQRYTGCRKWTNNYLDFTNKVFNS